MKVVNYFLIKRPATEVKLLSLYNLLSVRKRIIVYFFVIKPSRYSDMTVKKSESEIHSKNEFSIISSSSWESGNCSMIPWKRSTNLCLPCFEKKKTNQFPLVLLTYLLWTRLQSNLTSAVKHLKRFSYQTGTSSGIFQKTFTFFKFLSQIIPMANFLDISRVWAAKILPLRQLGLL